MYQLILVFMFPAKHKFRFSCGSLIANYWVSEGDCNLLVQGVLVAQAIPYPEFHEDHKSYYLGLLRLEKLLQILAFARLIYLLNKDTNQRFALPGWRWIETGNRSFLKRKGCY